MESAFASSTDQKQDCTCRLPQGAEKKPLVEQRRTQTARSCSPSLPGELDTRQRVSAATTSSRIEGAGNHIERDKTCQIPCSSDTASTAGVMSAASLPGSLSSSSSLSASSASSLPFYSSFSTLIIPRFSTSSSAASSIFSPPASPPPLPQKLQIPLENTVGYRNLEMFLSALLQRCSFLASQQRKAASLVLCSSLRHVDHRLFALKRWACRHWHVATVCGANGREKSDLPTSNGINVGLTAVASAEDNACAMDLSRMGEAIPRASVESSSSNKSLARMCLTKAEGSVKNKENCRLNTPKAASSASTNRRSTPRIVISTVSDNVTPAPTDARPSLLATKEVSLSKKARKEGRKKKDLKTTNVKERKKKAVSSFSQNGVVTDQQRGVVGLHVKEEELRRTGESVDKSKDILADGSDSSCLHALSSSSSSSLASSFPPSCEVTTSPLSSTLPTHPLRSERQVKIENVEGKAYLAELATLPNAKHIHVNSCLPLPSSVTERNCCSASNTTAVSAFVAQGEHVYSGTEKKTHTCQRLMYSSFEVSSEQQLENKKKPEQQKEEVMKHHHHQKEKQQIHEQQQTAQQLLTPGQLQGKQEKQASTGTSGAGPSGDKYSCSSFAKVSLPEVSKVTQGLNKHYSLILDANQHAQLSPYMQEHDTYSSVKAVHSSEDRNPPMPPLSSLRLEDKYGSAARRLEELTNSFLAKDFTSPLQYMEFSGELHPMPGKPALVGRFGFG